VVPVRARVPGGRVVRAAQAAGGAAPLTPQPAPASAPFTDPSPPLAERMQPGGRKVRNFHA
jgi:hypothetical protein